MANLLAPTGIFESTDFDKIHVGRIWPRDPDINNILNEIGWFIDCN